MGLPQRDELCYYASRLGTVELNNPFYRLPSREQFAAWASQTPGDFVFAVKASRQWAAEIERLAAPVHRTVYVYFNNDAYGWAPVNAAELRELLDAG